MDTERQIDEVAQAMTEGSPSSPLRVKIADRLTPRTTFPTHGPLVAVAAATALMIVGSSVWLTRQAGPGRTTRIERVAASSPNRPPPVTTPSPSKGVLQDVVARERLTRASVVPPSPHERDAESDSATLAPLVPSAPIEFDDIQPRELAIPLLNMTPLASEPVHIEPLGSTAGG